MFDQIVILSGWILNLIILAGYLLVVQSSLKENRFRPLLVSSLLAIPLIYLLTVLLLFPFDAKVLFFSLVLSVFLLLLAGVTIPFGKNPLARRLALWGDDLFYGRKPENEYSQEEWHMRV